MSLSTFVIISCAYVFIDGLVAMAGAVRAAEANQRWGPLLVEGVTGMMMAIIILSWPKFNELSLVYFIVAWALISISAICISVSLRSPAPAFSTT